jgi:hypothetical protein
MIIENASNEATLCSKLLDISSDFRDWFLTSSDVSYARHIYELSRKGKVYDMDAVGLINCTGYYLLSRFGFTADSDEDRYLVLKAMLDYFTGWGEDPLGCFTSPFQGMVAGLMAALTSVDGHRPGVFFRANETEVRLVRMRPLWDNMSS